MIEKGGDFGGTWYWNRYPGRPATSSPTSTCRCSKSSTTCRKRNTRFAPEILAHSQAIGRHFDLYRNACFQTEVTGMLHWDEDSEALDCVDTNRGDRHPRARFVA